MLGFTVKLREEVGALPAIPYRLLRVREVLAEKENILTSTRKSGEVQPSRLPPATVCQR